MDLSLEDDCAKNDSSESASVVERGVGKAENNKSLLVLRKHGDKLMISRRSARIKNKQSSLLTEINNDGSEERVVGNDSDECNSEEVNPLREQQDVSPLREQSCFGFSSDSDSADSSEFDVECVNKFSFICDVCGLKFKGENALTVHRKWKHTHVVNHECTFCRKSFRDSFCLKRHLRSVHTEDGDIRENLRSIGCSLCGFKAAEGSLVSKHYASDHGYEMVEEKMRFSSVTEFEEWKKNMESGTSTRFVKFRGSRSNRNGTTVAVYNCHRSGYYHSTKGKEKRLRSLKSKGSNKINGFCPATMSCIEYNGQVIVKFMMTHIGHDLEVEKLGLSKVEKDFIAEKLSLSIPMDKILEDIKESGANVENKRRIHVATRKDFYNIIDKYNLKGLAIYSQSKDEWKKFDSWVREIEQNSNLVRFYKPQGKNCDTFSEFKSEDFCLILASDDQLDLLKMHGNNCICIDNVYKENSNDFELHTVVVLDDVRESIPCAFVFSNRADDNALRVYFRVIKSILNVELCPRYFISDWANSIFNAWTSVNKEVPYKNLFSRWHIEKEWKRNLPKIKPKEKQMEIFRKVEELLTIRDFKEFEEKSIDVLSELFNNFETKTYANYIQKIICEPSSWAYCFRSNAEINISLNIDELHNHIEYFHSKGKKVKCLTKTAQALMNYAELKISSRSDTSFHDNVDNKMERIIFYHRMSSEMQESIIEITEQGWNVVSNIHGVELRYSVAREDCECSCSLVCHECDACIHAYSCTCRDSFINFNMCQHAHLIATCIRNHTITENMDATAEVVEVQMVNVDPVDGQSSSCDKFYPDGSSSDFQSEEVASEVHIKTEEFEDDNDQNSAHFVAKKFEFIERLTHIVNRIETEEELDAVILQNSPLEAIIQNVKLRGRTEVNSDEMNEPPYKKNCVKLELVVDESEESFNGELVTDNVEEADQIALEVIVE